MKKSNFKISILFCFMFLSLKNISGQECPLPSSTKVLEGNNISANIMLGGDLFWDRENGNALFQSPMNQQPFINTIFNAGLFVGAYDNQNQLKVAATIYPSENRKDFAAGPIINNNGTLEFDCENYDQLWEVFGYEIQQHISDFEDNGIIDHPILNIFGYPAHENSFFENIHGFHLPKTPQGLAPFYDVNNDGIYSPDLGEFPLPSSVNKNNIPSHIIWGIFNDGATSHTESMGEPLNIEVQLTAWAFSCKENEILNNSISVN